MQSLLASWRRQIAVIVIIVIGGFSPPVGAQGGGLSAPAADNMSIGNAMAPIVVAEYASLICRHCAEWQVSAFPELKRRYIDTGWVRFEFRELITEPNVDSAAGLVLARCVPRSSYFLVVDQLMSDQSILFGDGGLLPWLVGAGRVAGLDRQQVIDCAAREDILAAVNARVAANFDSYPVEGTPTVLVNGVLVGTDWGSLEAAIEAERTAITSAR